MRISSAKNPSNQPSPDDQESSKDASSSESDAILGQYQACILEEMEKAREMRIAKIQQLDDASQQCMQKFNEEFKELDQLGKKYFYQNESERKPIKADFVARRKALVRWCSENQNLDQFQKEKCLKVLKGLPILPSRLPGDSAVLKLRFFRKLEMQLNLLTNQLLYVQKVRNSIAENLDKVLKHYMPNQIVSGDIQIDLSDIGLSIDPHNGGASPLLVKLSDDKGTQLKIVYKPRDAKLDKKIIELFGDINTVNKDTDISTYGYSLLPVYKILSADDLRLPDGQEGSLWEYIDGPVQKSLHADDISAQCGIKPGQFSYKAVSTFVKLIGEQKPQDQALTVKKKYLFDQLGKLEKILTQLRVADLQSENIIIRGLDSDRPEIVPIDLEAIQYGKKYIRTGLVRPEDSDEAGPLTAPEQELVECFKLSQNGYISRILPARTSSFMKSASSIAKAILNVSKISQELERRGYEMLVDKSQLFRWIERQLIQGDVPYFTELNNVVHIGHPRLGLQVASLGFE